MIQQLTGMFCIFFGIKIVFFFNSYAAPKVPNHAAKPPPPSSMPRGQVLKTEEKPSVPQAQPTTTSLPPPRPSLQPAPPPSRPMQAPAPSRPLQQLSQSLPKQPPEQPPPLPKARDPMPEPTLLQPNATDSLTDSLESQVPRESLSPSKPPSISHRKDSSTKQNSSETGFLYIFQFVCAKRKIPIHLQAYCLINSGCINSGQE